MKKKGIIGIVAAGVVAIGAITSGITGTQNSDSIEISTSSQSSDSTEVSTSSQLYVSSVSSEVNTSKIAKETSSVLPQQSSQDRTVDNTTSLPKESQPQSVDKNVQQEKIQEQKVIEQTSSTQNVTPPSNSQVVYVTRTGKKISL